MRPVFVNTTLTSLLCLQEFPDDICHSCSDVGTEIPNHVWVLLGLVVLYLGGTGYYYITAGKDAAEEQRLYRDFKGRVKTKVKVIA